MSTRYFKRIWAEIDLDALSHNVTALKQYVSPGVSMMAVVKADAYGHGVETVSRTLEDAGVDWFAVSSISEAIQLRRFGTRLPILILGYTPPECVKELAEYQLTQTVYSTDFARALSDAADLAGLVIPCHLKLDVGMGRLGFRADTGLKDAFAVCGLPGLDIQGIFTHFPSADLDGDETGQITNRQLALFREGVDQLEKKGIRFALKHCCNSAASIAFPQAHSHMVREGIALYGLTPDKALDGRVDLKPAMSLKTVVSMVKTMHKGDTLSYGRTVTLKEDTRVATVCIGYADGYPRSLSGKGYMLVNGKKAPILGRVCMDQLLLDVTHIDNVEMGTEVTVFGTDGNCVLPAEEVASLCGTIHYELICVLGKRVPRVYKQQGKTVGVTDYIG